MSAALIILLEDAAGLAEALRTVLTGTGDTGAGDTADPDDSDYSSAFDLGIGIVRDPDPPDAFAAWNEAFDAGLAAGEANVEESFSKYRNTMERAVDRLQREVAELKTQIRVLKRKGVRS